MGTVVTFFFLKPCRTDCNFLEIGYRLEYVLSEMPGMLSTLDKGPIIVIVYNSCWITGLVVLQAFFPLLMRLSLRWIGIQRLDPPNSIYRLDPQMVSKC